MTKSKDHWFDVARFGMFIHWGVYALPGRGEWVKSNEKIQETDYEKYVRYFNPDLFDPKEWASLAKAAGMRYFVITAKHHDGFCLWDTKFTDYNAVKAPRCGRDLLREIIDAFRAKGLKVGIYYSLPDWHHPNYVIDARHPLRGDNEKALLKKPLERSSKIYTQFLHNQIDELLTNYGKIDLLWFDGAYPETEKYWDSPKLVKIIKKLQPNILINRLPGFSDFESPEQNIPDKAFCTEPSKVLSWEGCQVFSAGTWAFAHDQQVQKSPQEVIEMLIKHASRGGNMLLNVGPTSRGCLDNKTIKMLNDIAEWMRCHSRSIHNCTMAPEDFPEPEGGRYTWDPDSKSLYLHFLNWPDRRIFLENLGTKIDLAQLLCDGTEIQLSEHNPSNINGAKIPSGNCLLKLPVARPDTLVPVIELHLKKE